MQYGNVRYWNGKKISDMTTAHLINAIRYLKRQIDGSIHDEFVYDNVIAMENELKRRNEHGRD